MTIKQVKLAQALPGTASHLLEDKTYDLAFDKGILTVRHKTNRKHGTFMLFQSNIAYIELYEEVTGSASQEEDKELPKTSKPKK